jgi:hypothetical protein
VARLGSWDIDAVAVEWFDINALSDSSGWVDRDVVPFTTVPPPPPPKPKPQPKFVQQQPVQDLGGPMPDNEPSFIDLLPKRRVEVEEEHFRIAQEAAEEEASRKVVIVVMQDETKAAIDPNAVPRFRVSELDSQEDDTKVALVLESADELTAEEAAEVSLLGDERARRLRRSKLLAARMRRLERRKQRRVEYAAEPETVDQAETEVVHPEQNPFGLAVAVQPAPSAMPVVAAPAPAAAPLVPSAKGRLRPWAALAIGLGIGVLIGILVARTSDPKPRPKPRRPRAKKSAQSRRKRR